MFNLPQELPYALIIRMQNGFLVMSSKWTAEPDGRMGPISGQKVFDNLADTLSSVAEHFGIPAEAFEDEAD